MQAAGGECCGRSADACSVSGTLVAGIDSSTQSCKVLIRDLDTGRVVRAGRAAHPHGTEIDPELWWTALGAAIRQAGGLTDVSAVSIAAQQHGMVALDSNGTVVRPALLWNDTRSAVAASDLAAEIGAESYARRTGLVPIASFTAAKLRWLRDNEPENARRVAAVALPHDWLSWRLRGFGPRGTSERGPELTELSTDRSDASGTAYWNPRTGDYDHALLVAALGHDAILPRVLPPAGRAGTTGAYPEVMVPAGIVLAAGAGDNAAVALALNARPGDVVISIGTSGTVFAVTDSFTEDPSGTVAGFADATGRQMPLVATLNAARVLDSMAALLGVDHGAFSDLALAAAPGSGGLTLIPYFEGERTPNLPDASARLTGMTLSSTTRENVARASIEGMLAGLAHGVEAIRSQGVSAERALLTGGAASSAAVQTIASQVFDIPVVMPAPAEYAATGAAAQAGWALSGVKPEWQNGETAAPIHDYRPAIREQYDKQALRLVADIA
jgi:xylulokinase